MLEIARNLAMFKIKEMHFSDSPLDTDNCDISIFYWCKENKENKSHNIICDKVYTAVLDLTQDLDNIWLKNLSKHCRRKIRLAEEAGVRCLENQHFEDFFNIRDSFNRKLGLFNFLKLGNIKAETIKQYGHLLVSEYKGEILSGYVYIEDDNNMEAWVTASRRLNVDKEKTAIIAYANRLLLWEGIKYAKAKGLKMFDFGGIWPEEDVATNKHKEGMNRFKLDFGGTVVTRYNYFKIKNPFLKLPYALYRLANKAT
jgi:lipid II:glycine glycyltransferase (peptidoglycan interpeptide bridge formation enzyme)